MIRIGAVLKHLNVMVRFDYNTSAARKTSENPLGKMTYICEIADFLLSCTDTEAKASAGIMGSWDRAKSGIAKLDNIPCEKRYKPCAEIHSFGNIFTAVSGGENRHFKMLGNGLKPLYMVAMLMCYKNSRNIFKSRADLV